MDVLSDASGIDPRIPFARRMEMLFDEGYLLRMDARSFIGHMMYNYAEDFVFGRINGALDDLRRRYGVRNLDILESLTERYEASKVEITQPGDLLSQLGNIQMY